MAENPVTAAADPDRGLTARALHDAIAAGGTSPADPPAGVPAAPADPALENQLARMREAANLHGFAITANHPVVGLRTVKRLLRRLQYQVFARQSDFNDAALLVAERFVAAERRRRVGEHADERAEHRLRQVEARLAELRERTTELAGALERAQAERERLAPSPPVEKLDYVGLQARFRGDPVEITERQRHYVGCFPERGDVLDIGCGRGEFLELLEESGRRPTGVDTDTDMVALCRDRGFDVVLGDGMRHLAAQPEASLDGVFAAQVIEHLPPNQIAGLLRGALRALRPGGTVVLETVNPTSLVALMNFYLDFTHVAPVHPLALEWLAQSIGFAEVEISYLSPVEGGPRLRPFPGETLDLEERRRFDEAVAATNQVLYGPRDYALIARRS